MSESDCIWNELEQLAISVFALPAKPISFYFKRVLVSPVDVHVRYTVSAAVPVLEARLSGKYIIEQVEGNMLVIKKVLPLSKN